MTPPRSPTATIALGVVIAVVAALAHVWVHLQVLQVGYDLSRESKLRHDLGEQNQKLHLELAVRKDPSVIERRARQELQMAPPDPTLLRVISMPAVSSVISLSPSSAISSSGGAAGATK